MVALDRLLAAADDGELDDLCERHGYVASTWRSWPDDATAVGRGRRRGLRNVLVHRYTDIDVNQVAGAVDNVLDGFGIYVKQVARFAKTRQPS